MERSEPNYIERHFCCPSCDYDWYLGPRGRCPECGLHNGGNLLEQYEQGRRPFPLEYPMRSSVPAFLRTILLPSAGANAVRGYPADAARRTYKIVFVVGALVFVLFAFAYHAIRFANDGSALELESRSARDSASVQVRTPSAGDYHDAARWLPVTASFIIIAQLVIRRHVLSVLRKSADLDEGDAIRLYTFISPWLAMLLIGWNAANLAAFGVLAMVHEAHVAGMLWRMIWLLIVYAAWSGWRRRLYDGITFFADRGPDLGKRLSRSLAVGAVTGAVICYFIMEIAYVGIISSTCSPDSLKWPHLQ